MPSRRGFLRVLAIGLVGCYLTHNARAKLAILQSAIVLGVVLWIYVTKEVLTSVLNDFIIRWLLPFTCVLLLLPWSAQ